MIKEQKYTILSGEMFDSLDWNRTYQTSEDARWNIAHTEFIISIDTDSDYLPESNWVNGDTMREIVQDISWRGEDLPTE
jgi:hypothetical protein